MICISIYPCSLFEPKAKFHYKPVIEKPNPFLTSDPTVKNPYFPDCKTKDINDRKGQVWGNIILRCRKEEIWVREKVYRDNKR